MKNFLDKIFFRSNNLEEIAVSKYPKLKFIKLYLEALNEPVFVRMTGSGSAIENRPPYYALCYIMKT